MERVKVWSNRGLGVNWDSERGGVGEGSDRRAWRRATAPGATWTRQDGVIDTPRGAESTPEAFAYSRQA